MKSTLYSKIRKAKHFQSFLTLLPPVSKLMSRASIFFKDLKSLLIFFCDLCFSEKPSSSNFPLSMSYFILSVLLIKSSTNSSSLIYPSPLESTCLNSFWIQSSSSSQEPKNSTTYSQVMVPEWSMSKYLKAFSKWSVFMKFQLLSPATRNSVY